MKKSNSFYFIFTMFVAVMFIFASCTKEGPAGPAGADGTNGTNGEDGIDGTDGTAELTQVMRAKNPQLLDESTHVRENGKFSNEDDTTEDGDGIKFISTQEARKILIRPARWDLFDETDYRRMMKTYGADLDTIAGEAVKEKGLATDRGSRGNVANVYRQRIRCVGLKCGG